MAQAALLAALQSIAAGDYDPRKVLASLTAESDLPQAPQSPQGQHAPPVPPAVTGPPTPGVSAPQTFPAVEIQGKASLRALAAVRLAETYMGTPYVWGGAKPGGFDCSGLLQYVWAQKGVSIPRVTYDQFKAGVAVPKARLRPGDAVFFTGSDSKDGLPGHVGMYIGGGQFIEAPHTGAVVRISKLAGRTDYAGARRYG